MKSGNTARHRRHRLPLPAVASWTSDFGQNESLPKVHGREIARADQTVTGGSRSAGLALEPILRHSSVSKRFAESFAERQFGGLLCMLRDLSILAISALMVGSFNHPASRASIGAGNPYPVSNYKCQDGTRLAVRLLGDRASVSVNGADEVDLPSMGPEGTTYSNGRWTVTIVQGRLSWGVGRGVPSVCTDD